MKYLSILTLAGLLAACDGDELEAPNPPAFVHDVPANWPAAQQERSQAIDAHIQQHRVAYDRFANFPVSETDGIPFIILKLFPAVAPEFWGGKENFLDVIGLFNDERLPGYPAPRGIGFSGLSRKDAQGNIDYASFTCGGCHIGRVRLDDGSMKYLDGGINAEFNVIGFRKRVTQTLAKIYQGETDPAKQQKLVADAFLGALDAAHKKDANFFYNNYSYEGRNFDAAYEQAQIDQFKKQADSVIPKFIHTAEQVYRGWGIVVDKIYPEIKTEIMQGYPGTEDAIAFNAANAYFSLKNSLLTTLFAPLALPSYAGVTDIMAVWNQDTRNPRWNQDKTDLINGGGQWNGHIPLPIYKNIAAQLTIGFENIDVRVSAFSDQLLDKLPSPAYPFAVDVELAKKGKALFADNCAACHQPNNGKVYRNIGTHLGRAKIAGTLITLGAQNSFTKVCSPTLTVDMHGTPAQPCADYKGVSLDGKKGLAMTSPKLHDGYNALPLIGIWAQGPYLHNGSVPTLYHMLVPSERPARFIKSRLDFDKEKVGFSWNPDAPSNPARKEGYLLNTALSPVLSNAGHDHDIQDGGKTFKLDWSDDKAGAMAIIEYLKTL
ncbi:MAG: c-type cytochrome [Methylobacter sp.]